MSRRQIASSNHLGVAVLHRNFRKIINQWNIWLRNNDYFWRTAPAKSGQVILNRVAALVAPGKQACFEPILQFLILLFLLSSTRRPCLVYIEHCNVVGGYLLSLLHWSFQWQPFPVALFLQCTIQLMCHLLYLFWRFVATQFIDVYKRKLIKTSINFNTFRHSKFRLGIQFFLWTLEIWELKFGGKTV